MCTVKLWEFLEIVIVEIAQKRWVEGFTLFRLGLFQGLSVPIHLAEYAGIASRDEQPLSGLSISNNRESAPGQLKARLLHLCGRFACLVFAWLILYLE